MCAHTNISMICSRRSIRCNAFDAILVESRRTGFLDAQITHHMAFSNYRTTKKCVMSHMSHNLCSRILSVNASWTVLWRKAGVASRPMSPALNISDCNRVCIESNRLLLRVHSNKLYLIVALFTCTPKGCTSAPYFIFIFGWQLLIINFNFSGSHTLDVRSFKCNMGSVSSLYIQIRISFIFMYWIQLCSAYNLFAYSKRNVEPGTATAEIYNLNTVKL